MATHTLRVCDRCGFEYRDVPGSVVPDEGTLVRVQVSFNDKIASKFYDLCDECFAKMKSFMRGE